VSRDGGDGAECGDDASSELPWNLDLAVMEWCYPRYF
jgi:hypothetical protein